MRIVSYLLCFILFIVRFVGHMVLVFISSSLATFIVSLSSLVNNLFGIKNFWNGYISLLIMGHFVVLPALIAYGILTFIYRDKFKLVGFLILATTLSGLYGAFFTFGMGGDALHPILYLFIFTGFFTGLFHYFLIRRSFGVGEVEKKWLSIVTATVLVSFVLFVGVKHAWFYYQNSYTPLDRDCRRAPNLECLQENLAQKVQYPKNPAYIGDLIYVLARADLPDAARKVADKSGQKIEYTSGVARVVAELVYHKAMRNPEIAVSLDFVDEWSKRLASVEDTRSYELLNLSVYGEITKKLLHPMGSLDERYIRELYEGAVKSDGEINTTLEKYVKLRIKEVLDKPFKDPVPSLVHAASLLVSIGDVAAAREFYNEHLKDIRVPDDRTVKLLLDLNEYDTALEMAKEAERKNSSLYRLVDMLIERGDIDRARLYAEQIDGAEDLAKSASNLVFIGDLAEMYHRLALQDKARLLADHYYESRRVAPNARQFDVGVITVYRKAGEDDIARNLVMDLLGHYERKCVIDHRIGGQALAEELVLLGIDEAMWLNYTQNCSAHLDRHAWLEINTHLVRLGQREKLDDITWRSMEDKIYAYSGLAAVYFKSGYIDEGTDMLAENIEIAEQARNINQICNIAAMAYYSGRQDYVETLFAKSLMLIERQNRERKPPRSSHKKNKKRKIVENSRKYMIYNQYLDVAGCFATLKSMAH